MISRLDAFKKSAAALKPIFARPHYSAEQRRGEMHPTLRCFSGKEIHLDALVGSSSFKDPGETVGVKLKPPQHYIDVLKDSPEVGAKLDTVKYLS